MSIMSFRFSVSIMSFCFFVSLMAKLYNLTGSLSSQFLFCFVFPLGTENVLDACHSKVFQTRVLLSLPKLSAQPFVQGAVHWDEREKP